MKPVFSIIMPSYLGDYPGAAKDRDRKIIRAVESINAQTFVNWELIVMADGCQETVELLRPYASESVLLFSMPKAEKWCVSVRNGAINEAQGEWIAYLDIDDYWGTDHLSSIHKALQEVPEGTEWAWMDVLWWRKKDGAFYRKRSDLKRCTNYGTANIVHRSGHYWPEQRRDSAGRPDYSTQDCAFVERLKRTAPGVRIEAGEYHVCHIPGHVAGAYDV